MYKLLTLIFFLAAFIYPQSIYNLQNDIKKINFTEVKYDVQVQTGKKSAGLALLYSLILPGMGELYAGNYSTGKYFTIAEGALWLTYAGINTYGNWVESRYKSFAVSNAGIDPTGKDEDYYAIISEYFNVEEFNDEQALNRSFNDIYDTREYYWNWQNPNDRRSYRSMWISSEQAYNNLRFVVGGLVLNRIISAINAVRGVAAHNRRLAEGSWNVSVSYSQDITNPGLRINFITVF